MDGDSSSDDEELNSVKKQIQNHQIENKPSRKRKELSAASIPEGEQGMMGEHDGGVPLVGGKAFKENLHFPWLELVGPTCHSVKQVKAGIDLTHVKKKYRNMRCIICAQYNPSTPWAEVWARKFELQTLVDHAKSSAHVKSDTAFKSSPDYNADSEPLQSMIKVVSGSGKALQVDKAARDEALEAAAAAAVAAGNIDVDGFGHGGAKSNVRIRGASGGGHVIAHSTRIRPDWLYSEGSLCLSDKQATDPTLVHNTKKKYKQMACLYCREYVPDSMWAQLRPRKFESAVIGDHERSACHQKALELRASRMGGMPEGLQGMAPPQQQQQQQQQHQQPQLQMQLQQHAPMIHLPHLQHASALDRLPNVTEVHHEVGEAVTFV